MKTATATNATKVQVYCGANGDGWVDKGRARKRCPSCGSDSLPKCATRVLPIDEPETNSNGTARRKS